jgi:SHS2 domain-containing protein
MREYEVLEHTADVGVRATGSTVEEAFEAATLGLADIAGIWRPGIGEETTIEMTAEDLGALLVDWLSEVLYVHDARGVALTGVTVNEVTIGRARGAIAVTDLGENLADGIQVKAVTYHQLKVERGPSGWVAQVFFDI